MPFHAARLLTYMNLAEIKEGFLINFNAKRMKDGIKRYAL